MVIILIFSFASGCSTFIRVNADEVRSQPDRDYNEIVFPSALYGAVVSLEKADSLNLSFNRPDSTDTAVASNILIVLEPRSGSLDISKRVVSGVDTVGTPFSLGFEEVEHLGFKNTDISPLYMTFGELIGALEEIELKPYKRIKPTKIPYWDVVSFDKKRGRLDESSDHIAGTSKEGTQISIGVDEIHYLSYKKFDGFKTLRFGLGLAIIAAFTQGIFIISGSD
jgi:hypothetical protein